MNDRHPSRFSPRSEPFEALQARTVCRDPLVGRLVESLAGSVRDRQARFDLVLGPRGAGKSHLLGLVLGRLRDELAGEAVVAAVAEDFHPTSLVHLLAEVLRECPQPDDAPPLQRRLDLLADAGDDAIERATTMLGHATDGNPLVIVIENLDTTLRALGRSGQQQLRSLLQTNGTWSMLASSRTLSPAVLSKESAPFYGTFKEHRLKQLSAGCCQQMLVALAEQTEQSALVQTLSGRIGLARVKALRNVLGGYPRAMAFVFRHLAEDRTDDLTGALVALAEELTPYFQEQLARLSDGQRPIVELLAENWRPLSVGEISRRTFAPQASTSTHLRRLREDALVRALKVGRVVFYELADPLFRVARAMKRPELQSGMLLRVLQAWYSTPATDEEMERLAARTLFDGGYEFLENVRSKLLVELGQYQLTVFEGTLSRWRRGENREAVEYVRARLQNREPYFTGWLAVALALNGQPEEALAELEDLRGAGLLSAFAAIHALCVAAPKDLQLGRFRLAGLAAHLADWWRDHATPGTTSLRKLGEYVRQPGASPREAVLLTRTRVVFQALARNEVDGALALAVALGHKLRHEELLTFAVIWLRAWFRQEPIPTAAAARLQHARPASQHRWMDVALDGLTGQFSATRPEPGLDQAHDAWTDGDSANNPVWISLVACLFVDGGDNAPRNGNREFCEHLGTPERSYLAYAGTLYWLASGRDWPNGGLESRVADIPFSRSFRDVLQAPTAAAAVARLGAPERELVEDLARNLGRSDESTHLTVVEPAPAQ